MPALRWSRDCSREAEGETDFPEVMELNSGAENGPDAEGVRELVQWIQRSYTRWTGRAFPVDPAAYGEHAGFARAVFDGPFVLLSHGEGPDPILNYGNRMALELWEMDWATFTSTPSRLSAEAPDRAERARLLQTVTARGFIDDYAGVRISRTGRRFRIEDVTVWNWQSRCGDRRGQAALFLSWEYL